MPPGKCAACEQLVSALDSLKCVGPCSRFYHLSCARIKASEVDFLIIDGRCRYKCYNCTRHDSDDAVITDADSLATNVEQLLATVAALRDSADSILTYVKNVAAEIKLLRKEYSELKSYFQELSSTASLQSNVLAKQQLFKVDVYMNSERASVHLKSKLRAFPDKVITTINLTTLLG